MAEAASPSAAAAAAALAASAARERTRATDAAALTAHAALLDAGLQRLPVLFTRDLLFLLGRPPYDGFRTGTPWPEEDSDGILTRYQTEFVQRLLPEPAFAEAVRLVQCAPAASGERALLTREFLEFACLELDACWPDHWPAERVDWPLTSDALPADDDATVVAWRGELRRGLEHFLAAARQRQVVARLFDAGDLYVLRAGRLLADAHLRRACRQIAAARAAVPPPDWRSVCLLREQAETATRLTELTCYPSGGFGGLTTSGPLENLLPTELLYLDEPTPEDDLFSTRYAQGEQLYYLRDEGVLVRRQVTLQVTIDHAQCMTLQYPWHRYRLSNLLHGCLLAFIRDLDGLFPNCAVHCVFHRYAPPGRPDLVDEQQKDDELLQFILREEEALDRVRFVRAGEARSYLDASPAVARYLLVLGHDAVSEPLRDLARDRRTWQRAAVVVAGAAAGSEQNDGHLLQLPVPLMQQAGPDWARATRRILRHYFT